MTAADDAPIDPLDFRRVLGHFPTGVTVVTAAPDGEPQGMTVGSFFSISLDPPLVGLCADKRSTSWPRIDPAGVFAVNVLADDQAHLSSHFASKADDKFEGIEWRPGVTGSPILAGVVGHIDCRTEQSIDAGDHWIVVGRVVELDVDRETRPLLFFQGGYGRFEPVTAD
ncbi:MAG TPA: flavin reductase family protein [Acidimicrobiales bacterium]|nr:flavin reductase family protein [Acidimicrobiales bacterium]